MPSNLHLWCDSAHKCTESHLYQSLLKKQRQRGESDVICRSRSVFDDGHKPGVKTVTARHVATHCCRCAFLIQPLEKAGRARHYDRSRSFSACIRQRCSYGQWSTKSMPVLFMTMSPVKARDPSSHDCFSNINCYLCNLNQTSREGGRDKRVCYTTRAIFADC